MPRYLTQTIEIRVDVDWYIFTYEDARKAIEAGIYQDALDHYLTVGIRDGRLPAEPDVDEAWYRERYPDVQQAILHKVVRSAKEHYARWGYREGRFPFGSHPGANYEATRASGSSRDAKAKVPA